MKKIIFTNLLNPVSWDKAEYQAQVFITIEENRILSISKDVKDNSITVDDMSDCVCYPGFIDLHTHIYQYNIRGSYKSHLLEWLNTFTFPEERKTSESDYSNFLAAIAFDDLVKSGTSTACIYSTIFKNAFETAFNQAEKKGIRAIIGKVMMDVNSPEYLTENTEQSINDSIELFNKYNKLNPLLEYCFTPRFALSCSFNLMQRTGIFVKNNSSYIQTHISENKDEIESVKKYFSNSTSYTDIYAQADLLTPKTLLAHAIHLNNTELSIIRKARSSIVHCPDSNFFLKSGEFPLDRIINHQIPFGLGSDVGAGTTFYMPYHARMMIYRQNKYQVSPFNAFYSFTLGAAEALRKANIIGSIKPLKYADMTFIKQETDTNDMETILSKLIFTSTQNDVKKLIVNGLEVYKNIEI